MIDKDQTTINNVIFDLDGTLIDSAVSILASMGFAFNKAGIEPIRPLSHDLIGPPLTLALSSIISNANISALHLLIEEFQIHYDESGYLESRIYEGVPEMLNELRNMGKRLYIVTNKRFVPTLKIINHLGWIELFEGIYTLDYFTPALPDKTALLQRVIKDFPSISDGSIFVGDRLDDAYAAIANKMSFLLASWGYGGPAEVDDFRYDRILDPSQLYKILD